MRLFKVIVINFDIIGDASVQIATPNAKYHLPKKVKSSIHSQYIRTVYMGAKIIKEKKKRKMIL